MVVPVLGWGPYAAFLDHLPGLVGGEAFPAFRKPAAVAINCSIPGLVFKLPVLALRRRLSELIVDNTTDGDLADREGDKVVMAL